MSENEQIIWDKIKARKGYFSASELHDLSVIETALYDKYLNILPVPYKVYEQTLKGLEKLGKIHHIGFKPCIYKQREKIYKII